MSACYIAGNASNGFWDTAGESVDINGMDITTLEGSVVNWEHKSEKSSDYVGKILKAKKIFSAEDCSNELEKKYWDKCQVPFLFCLCVLFNEYMPAAKEVAGIFEFDAANPSLKPTLGFSIEGSKAEVVSGVVTKSIARKLTLTAQPANHACDAGKVDLNAPAEPVDPLSNLFKSQSVEIELLSLEKLEKMEKSMNPAHPPKAPKPGLKQAPVNEGMSIGTTQSGKHVMSHAKIHSYNDFSAQDHRDASVHHGNAAAKANTSKNSKLADMHNQKMKLHHQAAAGLERKANRFGNATKAKHQHAEANKILGKTEPMNKAMEAGSALSAPGNKTQGAALEPLMKPYTSEAQRRWAHTKNGKEALGGDAAVHEWDEATKGKKLPEKVKKSEVLQRAEEAYAQWEKREQFEEFMSKRMPHLAKGEIKALGQTYLLKKSVEAEKSLKKLMKK